MGRVSVRQSVWVGLCVAWCGVAQAQPGASGGDPIFGFEMELRATGSRVDRWEDQRYSNFERIMEVVARELGGSRSEIRRVDWTVQGPNGQPRTLFRAEWTDPRGRTWKIEPEYVDSRAPTGYELVTPRMDDPRELERVVRALETSGRVAEGIKSSVHVHVNGAGLIGPNGNATGVVNLINLHETYEPLLRRLFRPARGAGLYNHNAAVGAEGAFVNRFNRPLYMDHPELLQELERLPESERTRETLERMFRSRLDAEARAHGVPGGAEGVNEAAWKKLWKYRSLNLVNLLGINDALPAERGSVEFRMNDLNLRDAEVHRLQVEFYRALVMRAEALAREGRVVEAPRHARVPMGEDPALYLTPESPQEARERVREMLREMGLQPERYERLIARNVVEAPVLSERGFRRSVDALQPSERVAFRVGGEAVAGIDAALRAMQPDGGRAQPLELRVPLVEGAVESARRLAERANAATWLLELSHAGARAEVPVRERVRVTTEGSEVVLRVAPDGLSRGTISDLARVLLDGVERLERLEGRAGLPEGRGSLVERAREYARTVEGRTLSAEVVRTVEAIGRGQPSLELPLRAWSEASYVQPATERDLRFRAEVFTRGLIDAAEAVVRGEATLEEARTRGRAEVRRWASETRLGWLAFRSLLPPPRGREAVRLAEAAGRTVDPLARYRRADGTLRWGEVTRDRALREGAGLAHFALALFLKELAVVAATGDRARIEEFFDGLMTTDFYVHYGLFVVGARAGEMAYTRYLQRYVKPRFVNGILKTNLVLATGIALPELVAGRFEGKTFAISLGSLGLSSAAVRTTIQGIRWVRDLRTAEAAGAVARTATAASRLRRFGGWFYTAAELAVVLYLAEEIEGRVHAYLDAAAAREAVGEASEAFLAAARDPSATRETLEEAAAAYHEAWSDYRNFLYSPLFEAEVELMGRLERYARRAKLAEDERNAAIERVSERPRLRRAIDERYGSVEAYAEHLLAEDEAELQEELDVVMDSYQRSREAGLVEVYEGERRGTGLLDEVGPSLGWALRGGEVGAAGDPYSGREDWLAGLGRYRTRDRLEDALRDPSSNRLETYGDERAVLEAVERYVLRGRPALAEVVASARARVDETEALDGQLYRGDGTLTLNGSEMGLIDRLEDAVD